MDWVRLKASSSDLAQRKGTPLRRSIPLSELQEHKSQHDCWIALKGVVYQVSSYLPYHPGGKKIVMAYAGRDATKEFQRYHAWVNIEGLVGVLKVGLLEEEGGGGRKESQKPDPS